MDHKTYKQDLKMEMVLNNGFTDINDENLHNINAGVWAWAKAVIWSAEILGKTISVTAGGAVIGGVIVAGLWVYLGYQELSRG